MSANRLLWDAASTLERLGGDERLFHEIIKIFLEEAPKHIASMKEALAQGNTNATERIAHTLKGELGYLGVIEASHNARRLEDAGRSGDLERAADIQARLEQEVEQIVDTMRGVLDSKPGALSQARPSGAN